MKLDTEVSIRGPVYLVAYSNNGNEGIVPILALLVILQLALDHVDHDVVRHESTLIHNLLRLSSQLRLRRDLRAQHVTSCKMAAGEFVLDRGSLGAFASAGRSC